jgi:hypothetical protein
MITNNNPKYLLGTLRSPSKTMARRLCATPLAAATTICVVGHVAEICMKVAMVNAKREKPVRVTRVR